MTIGHDPGTLSILIFYWQTYLHHFILSFHINLPSSVMSCDLMPLVLSLIYILIRNSFCFNLYSFLTSMLSPSFPISYFFPFATHNKFTIFFLFLTEFPSFPFCYFHFFAFVCLHSSLVLSSFLILSYHHFRFILFLSTFTLSPHSCLFLFVILLSLCCSFLFLSFLTIIFHALFLIVFVAFSRVFPFVHILFAVCSSLVCFYSFFLP